MLFTYYLTIFSAKIMLHRYFCTRFFSIFSAFSAKIEKNSHIFCNFFSLCINDLEES